MASGGQGGTPVSVRPSGRSSPRPSPDLAQHRPSRPAGGGALLAFSHFAPDSRAADGPVLACYRNRIDAARPARDGRLLPHPYEHARPAQVGRSLPLARPRGGPTSPHTVRPASEVAC